MSRVTLTALCLILIIIKQAESADSACSFSQELTVGTTYYIYNSEYPYRYSANQKCVWNMKSDYRINLNCTTFELPWSINCIQDSMTVQVNANTSHRFCGNGLFNITSSGPSMVVTVSSALLTTGGRYLCAVTAIKRPQDSEDCRCGWKNPTRIVGGMNTGVNEFPMMAGLIDSTLGIVYCGSTIISSRYVVTAGHCIDGRNIQNLGVLVGDHDLSTGSDTNATVLHRVVRAVIHPKYANRGAINDIALAKTDTEIVFSNQVGPVCLPFQHSPDTFGGNYVEALGWGSTSFGGGPSDILQKVTLSVLTNLECSKLYKNVTAARICTYGRDKDSCQFDSGGPVLWQNPSTRRVLLVGIISQGRDCGVSAGINTRVGAYVDWIVSETSDAAYCINE